MLLEVGYFPLHCNRGKFVLQRTLDPARQLADRECRAVFNHTRHSRAIYSNQARESNGCLS